MLTPFWRLIFCDQHCTVRLYQRSRIIPNSFARYFGVDGLCRFWKAKVNQNIILLNATFYNLSTDIFFSGGFIKNGARMNFFSGGHPRRFGVPFRAGSLFLLFSLFNCFLSQSGSGSSHPKFSIRPNRFFRF